MPHVGCFWHLIICCIFVCVYLFFCICMFDTWEYDFCYRWTILSSKIYHMLGLSGTSSYAVFVYLCILYLYFCICMFDTREYHFWYPWTILFSKICHMMGLYGTVNMLYLCICVFVFVYLCMRHLVISVLISLDQVLSENIWFVWSKPSYSGDKWRCHRCETGRWQTTSEDRATQLLICEALSLAMFNC